MSHRAVLAVIAAAMLLAVATPVAATDPAGNNKYVVSATYVNFTSEHPAADGSPVPGTYISGSVSAFTSPIDPSWDRATVSYQIYAIGEAPDYTRTDLRAGWGWAYWDEFSVGGSLLFAHVEATVATQECPDPMDETSCVPRERVTLNVTVNARTDLAVAATGGSNVEPPIFVEAWHYLDKSRAADSVDGTFAVLGYGTVELSQAITDGAIFTSRINSVQVYKP
jgi:hypothetical protein